MYYPVLAVLAASFAVCAIVTRWIKLHEHEDSEQQSDEATTGMSGELAVVLLLWGAVVWLLGQALMVRLAAEATRYVSPLLEQLQMLSKVWILAAILAAVLGRGHLQGIYHYVLFAGSGTVPLSFRLFFIAGLVIVLFRYLHG